MSETNDQAPATPGPTPEAVAAVEAAGVARAEQIDRDARSLWGPSFDRRMAAGELAIQRLGIDAEGAAEAERLLGPIGALEFAAEAGEGLAMIDPETTPAEALERIAELVTDRAFFERMRAGDRVAHKVWNGLNLIAARGREPSQ